MGETRMGSASATAAGSRFGVFDQVELCGRNVWVPRPHPLPDTPFVDRDEILEQATAAWMPLDGIPPQSFRLYGPPGVGKNAVVYQLARSLGKNLYELSGHEDLGPEDVACSAVMTSGNTVEYVASPLLAAMLRGGICFFDEIGKAPRRALDLLAATLDERRTLTSVLAGLHIKAHEGFLFCASLNEDEENAGRLPDFLDERLTPAIRVGHPSAATLRRILEAHFSHGDPLWIDLFLQECATTPVSPRVAVKRLQFAFRRAVARGRARPGRNEILEFLRGAVRSGADGTCGKGVRDGTLPKERAHDDSPSAGGGRKTSGEPRH